jgi:two-component system, response regulator RegA
MTEKGIRLLIIDDEPVFTQVLARAFSRRGYEVREAHDAVEAMALVESFQPQRVTLDLKMVHSSGLQLIPQLLKALPELNIVVLTGYSSIATAVQAIKLGASNYLCKPANADEILAAFEAQGSEEVAVEETPISVNRLEWEHIQKVLAEHEGNISATARALGMHRRTLQRKLYKRPVQR